MNKRPHPGMGLPAKPYTPHAPGPAPPLPAGPPPAQPQTYNEQQNAHAAAWAAYYQAQGVTSAPGYNAAPQADPSAAASNPYANYGYGAGAPHAAQAQNQNAGYSAPAAGGYNAGPSYRPPPQQQPPQQSYASPMQQQQQGGYNGQNYNAGAASPGGYNARPPYNNQQNQGYGGWNQQQAPQTPQHQQGYNNGGYNAPQQPYYPQSSPSGHASPSVNQPYRPAPAPQNQPNRPYQPQPGPQRSSIPPRPPAPGGQGGGPGGFPPAKRPRFDGPGGAGGPGIPPRPPSQSGRNPSGPGGGGGGGGGGFGSGMARPMGGGGGGGGGRGGSPMSSASIPRIGFNTPPRGGGPMRGGMGRGGGPMMSGRGGGMMGAPRGPSHLRRNDLNRTPGPRQGRGIEPPRERERLGEKKRKDKNEKEARTTMTDFRIVGIEVKELGWSWGLVGEHVVEEVKAEEVKAEVEESDNAADSTKAEPTVKTEPEAEAEAEAEVKTEKEAEPEAEASEAVDEKRGEKRKAKAASVDGDAESQSPKKRNSSFHSTHGKPNLSEIKPPSSESNQNRFRIYFESPPELDRVPKSARRNPNKRWRRESSSVAPSRIGETEDGHDGAEGTEAQEEGGDAAAEGAEHTQDAEAAETAADAEAEAKPEEAAPAEGATEAPVAETQDTEAAPTAEGETAEPPASTDVESAKPQEDAPAEAEAEKPADSAPDVSEEATTEDVGDVSMVTDAAGVEAETNEAAETATGEGEGDDSAAAKSTGLTGAEATAAEMEAALAESAQNAASAYGNRGSKQARRWSTSTTDSQTESVLATLHGDVHQPSHNRVTVIYEESSRRLVFDASVVHKIRIFRGEGRIEVDLLPGAAPVIPKAESEDQNEGDKEETKPVSELPKGVMVETYDQTEQRFIATSSETLDQLTSSDVTLPPLHRAFTAIASSNPITLTVYLNKKKPLSEPKWCRTNQADEWLYEQFGRRTGGDAGWRGKLEIVDPDAPPTLSTILDQWKNGSSSGTTADRNDFTRSLLASPNDLLEILLRLTRGERNPTASIGTGPSSANGPLATVIRPDSPYASHQTHVSLAILAMYQLTTDFAQQAGIKTEVLNEKIADIIKSLPTHMIHKSLDGLYKEWLAERKGQGRSAS